MRTIGFYKNYFLDFYRGQDEKVQKKIEYVLDLVRHEPRVPITFFKYLENTEGIYEVRVRTTFKEIRILCFFNDGDIVILGNTFVKKTQKTPNSQIKLAEKLKTEYFKNKKNND